MKWRKLGKIFDPTEHQLPENCKEFAQSPQTLVFDDYVRVYFSTRSRDASGKFLSHVAFVDMTKDLSSILRVSPRSAIPLGELGAFDEHGIFPMNVIRRNGVIYAYTCGWSRRVSVSVETGVGLAVSHDEGESFRRVGAGPVLTSSPNEPFLVGDAFVFEVGELLHMWYIFGTEWKRYASDAPPDRTYKIGHAVSSDGIAWSKEEGRRIIADRLGHAESQALPTVVEIDGRYHMFFCYRQSFDFRANRDRGYRIGHAYSDDLQSWTRADDELLLDVSPDGWDSDMVCYPHVFRCAGKVYLLYNGNQFGRYGFGAAVLEDD